MRDLIQLHNMNAYTGMRSFPDKHFDIGILDMPYGLKEDGRKTKGREHFVKQKNGSKIFVPAKKYTVKSWDEKAPTQRFWNEVFRVCKYVIIWGEPYMNFKQKKESSGRIIWDKVNGNNDYSDCEIAWTNIIKSTRQIEYMWAGFQQGKSLKEGRTPQGNKQLNEERRHPTQKPVLLYKWLLMEFAKKGWKVLDTGIGSGNLAAACIDLGFELVAYEKDREYYRDAKEFIDGYISYKEVNVELNFEQKTIFDGVHL